jgi:hypothetical protein
MRFILQTIGLKFIVVAIACGLLLSLATGLVENSPGVSIMRFKYYGHPLAWRVMDIFGPTEFRFDSLAIDAAFWIAISLLALIVLEMLKSKVGFKHETLILPLILFIPLGLVMDFVHEFGHAIWATAVGGSLTYMQIAYFQIYPQLAIVPQFQLGLVRFSGLTTEFASGVMQLGGSSTTNIISWVLALILLRTNFQFKTKVALKILGIFGLLDLPLYVLFPQIGLHHWIFLGGCQPEPLIGARKMGIPDPAFYTIVVLTTLGLIFLYFKPFWEKAVERMKIFLGMAKSEHGKN